MDPIYRAALAKAQSYADAFGHQLYGSEQEKIEAVRISLRERRDYWLHIAWKIRQRLARRNAADYSATGLRRERKTGIYGLTRHRSGTMSLDGACGIEQMLTVLRALGFTSTELHETSKSTSMVLARKPRMQLSEHARRLAEEVAENSPADPSTQAAAARLARLLLEG